MPWDVKKSPRNRQMLRELTLRWDCVVVATHFKEREQCVVCDTVASNMMASTRTTATATATAGAALSPSSRRSGARVLGRGVANNNRKNNNALPLRRATTTTTAAITDSDAAAAAAAPSYSGAPRVVVLGGGFGGLYTALRLDSLTWPDAMRQGGAGSAPTPTHVPLSSHLGYLL